MKLNMDNSAGTNNSNDNASSSSSSSATTSTSLNPPPLPPAPPNYSISATSTQSTNLGHTGDSTTSSPSQPNPPAQNKPSPNECLISGPNTQNLIDQILIQQQQATLARHYHHMFPTGDHHHIHHLLHQDNHKFMTNRFNNHPPQYVDISASQSVEQPTSATAFLVQTPNGSALLIPPFLSANASLNRPTNQPNTGTLNPYGITTIPLANSPSVNVNLARPDSTTSTNVYQTIDAEKNGYLYPTESFYETTALTNTNSPNTLLNPHHPHNCSTRHKSKKSHQQCLQFHMQQTTGQTAGGQFMKLVEAGSSSSSSSSSSNPNSHKSSSSNNNSTNLTGTLHSNTNNTNQTTTNSNFFVSPALSAVSNRRFNGSSLDRIKFRLTQKFNTSKCCTWKFLAIFFLILTINFLSFTIYLSVMRMYNLNWHLKENQSNSRNQLISERRLTNSILFSKIGEIVEEKINPFDFLNLQLYLDAGSYIKFNLTLNRNSQMGIYADKNSPPTFTKFKIFESFDGHSLVTKSSKLELDKRPPVVEMNHDMVNTGFVHYLDEGLWYFSVFNDNKMPLRFRIQTEFYDYDNKNCPMNCHGKGDCLNGKCKCYPGFSGLDCSLSSCPLLCNGHGKYEMGRCLCDLDWHGSECQIPIDRCEVANCNGNGECINGNCMCYVGFRGKNCEQATCRSENCSNNGMCINGACRCFHNFTGADCSEPVTSPSQSSNTICSGHGDFDYVTRRCSCSRGWSGADCSQNENCLDKACASCRNGFAGLFCLDRVPLKCDSRCHEHGVCLNGSCACSPGFHGRHCDMNSCPKSCSLNGQCEKTPNGSYQCVCSKGWTGVACETPIEMVCNDNIDNDGDGLVDCMDSECCVFDNCKLSLACTSSPEPKDRLLRKQPPSWSASFFEKMKFLIEDDSVQTFAYPSTFFESQVSIIRGQVVFKNGQALIGVKVTAISNPSYGFTLTRNNGIFDLMVNGGGSILLEFTRSRLKSRIVSVNTAWNQFSHIDPIVMYLTEDEENEPHDRLSPSPCPSIDHNLHPTVRSCFNTLRSSHYPHQHFPVSADSGVLHTSLPIVDTNLQLVYTSSQSSGFQSTLFILLTPDSIPDPLRQVHLRIEVEGVVQRMKFDAQPMLRYEFAWDRRNAYEQRVYGFTWAKVRVGYEYEGCGEDGFVYWENVVVKLAGYDLGSSEIGSWNVDVHHRLNIQQGILHKGDGTTVYIKEIQKIVEIVAGKLKVKRDIDCVDCLLDGDIKFFSPYSVSVNKDGVIFVADFNYIWMLNGTEPGRAVLELKKDQPYKYYISNEPQNGNLFISDPINRQIISLKRLDQSMLTTELKSNFKLADSLCSQCDPTRPIPHLLHPKGITFDTNGIMYYVDQNEIKSVGSGGRTRVVVAGSSDLRPIFECRTSWHLDAMRLRWPTTLAVNPIDNNLYVLDDGDVIYKITGFNTVELVAGVPAGCRDEDAGGLTRLNRVVDFAFAPDGDLFVLENDESGAGVRQIRVIKSSGHMEIFFGDGQLKSGFSMDVDSKFSGFNDPISIAVHPNRSVYVLDKGDNVLYHIKPTLLRDDEMAKYTIVSTDTREAYIFNRFGLHMHTMDLVSGAMMYNFTYNGNAFYGKLTSITDQARTLLVVKRDFNGRAEFIQTASGQSMKLKLNNLDMLRSLTVSDNRSYVFNYMGNVGLLVSRTDPNDKTTVFNYEKTGKVKEIIDSNQLSTNISYSIDSVGLVTTLNKDSVYSETWVMNSTWITLIKNGRVDSQIDTNRLFSGIRSLSSDQQLGSFRQMLTTKSAKKGKGRNNESGGKSGAHSNRKLINKLT